MCPQSCLGDAGEDGCCLRCRTLSYARLWEEALRKRDELIGEGLAPGRLHIFRVSQDEDFIATYLAVHMAAPSPYRWRGTALRSASATSWPATAI